MSLRASARFLRLKLFERRAETRLALRVTTAIVASLILSQLLHLPMPLWTMLTSILLTQMSFGRSLKATADYLIGTLFGAVYGGLVVSLVPHHGAFALVAVLILVVAPLALLGAINPRFTTAAFTGVLVLMVPGMMHTSPIESAFFRVIEVAVGGVVALAVSFLVLPARAHVLAIDAAARMLELAARSVPELFAGLRAGGGADLARTHDNLGHALLRLNTVAAEARIEQLRFLDNRPDLGPLRRTLLRLRHDLVMIGRSAAEPLPEAIAERVRAPLARAEEAISQYLRGCGEALRARQPPRPSDAVEAALDGVAGAFAAAREDGALTAGLPVGTVERIFALRFALDQMRRNLRDLDRCVADSARGET